MPDFPFQFRVSDYLTDQGQIVRAKRAYLLCELSTLPVVCDAFFDTAAPFSVVPYTFSRHLPWNRLATRLAKAGGSASSVLLWQGIPCDLGSIPVRFVHPATGVRSGALHLLAKFPLRPALPSLERMLVLGLSLVDENDVRLVMDRGIGTLSGHLSAP